VALGANKKIWLTFLYEAFIPVLAHGTGLPRKGLDKAIEEEREAAPQRAGADDDDDEEDNDDDATGGRMATAELAADNTVSIMQHKQQKLCSSLTDLLLSTCLRVLLYESWGRTTIEWCARN
jgi:hypothetical protein